MKKALKITGIVILSIIALFLIIPLFIATDYQVEKTVTVDVDKETAYNYMADFSKFETWSPWAELDKDMKMEVQGEAGALGSIYKWKGNEDVGEGSMEIVELTPEKISIKLVFVEPFASESMTYYSFKENEGKTDITWSMEGSMAYPWNIMKLFMSMEDAIGKDFDKGLGKLKTLLEALEVIEEKPVVSEEFEINEIDLPQTTYIGKRAEIPFADLEGFFTENYPIIFETAEKKKWAVSGGPAALYFKWDEDSEKTDLAAVVPVSIEKNKLPKGFESWVLGGKAVHLAYYGSYENMEAAHIAIHNYIETNGKVMSSNPVIEQYVTDPEQEPDTSKWLTNIYYLID